MKYWYFNLTSVIFYAQLNDFMYRQWLNISIWAKDSTLTDTNTASQGGPGGMAVKEYSIFLKAPRLDP